MFQNLFKGGTSKLPREDFSTILEFELNAIAARREIAQKRDDEANEGEQGKTFKIPNGSDEIVGVALSGGGVRSATFNLGVLQAFYHYGFFKRIDYLSTVSGGGYIGSSFSWFYQRLHSFPFPRFKRDREKSLIMEWLRRHASYLVPGDGLDHWAFAAAILRGIAIHLMIVVPILYGLAFLARLYPSTIFHWLAYRFCAPEADSCLPSQVEDFLIYAGTPFVSIFESFKTIGFGYAAFITAGLVILVYLGWLVLYYPIATRFGLHDSFMKDMRKRSARRGQRLFLAALLLAIGTVPYVYRFLIPDLIGNQSDDSVIALLSDNFTRVIGLLGATSVAIGWFGRKKSGESIGWMNYAIKLGLLLVLYSVALIFYGLSNNIVIAYDKIMADPQASEFLSLPPQTWWLLGGLIVSLALILTADVNEVSLHKYYRNRLLEGYLPNEPHISGQGAEKGARWRADGFQLSEVNPHRTGAPIQLINTTITTISSGIPKYRIRGGDSFVFTPYACGSDATKGWASIRDTVDFQDNSWSTFAANKDHRKSDKKNKNPLDIDLATAMAVSGAAVDPNIGATRSRPLAIIMAFLNIRLGYWLPNPARALDHNASKNLLLKMSWAEHTWREIRGWLDERQRYVHLSDGGHFENLGLYELVRRKCKYIVVSDASADFKFRFGDLARAIQRVRVDHNAEIEINTQLLQPEEDKISSAPYVIGRIIYDAGTNHQSIGTLIYLKSAVCANLPEDIYGYMRANEKFPDESTADQFFGDQQFEAYRELGFRLAEKLFKRGKGDNQTLNEVFESAYDASSELPMPVKQGEGQ